MAGDAHGGKRRDVAEAAQDDGWQQSDTTGFPNAGASFDEGKTMKRWRRLAGLDDCTRNVG